MSNNILPRFESSCQPLEAINQITDGALKLYQASQAREEYFMKTISDLLIRVDSLEQSKQAAEGKLEAAEGKLEATEVRLTEALSELDKVKSVMSNFNGNISTNRSISKTADSNVSILRGEMKELQNIVDSKLSSLKSDLTVSNNKILTNKLAINSLSKGGTPNLKLTTEEIKNQVSQSTTMATIASMTSGQLPKPKKKYDQSPPFAYNQSIPDYFETTPRFLRYNSREYRAYPYKDGSNVHDILDEVCNSISKLKGYPTYSIKTSAGLRPAFHYDIIEQGITQCVSAGTLSFTEGHKFITLVENPLKI